MKVVLLENIKGIGRAGDLKEVTDGYARNFLFPRRLGKPASDGVMKDVAALQQQRLTALSLGQAQAHTAIAALKGATVVVSGKANQKGTLFSGISRAQVAEALSAVAGTTISPENIEAADHLKTVGMHTVSIRLGENEIADVAVRIEAL